MRSSSCLEGQETSYHAKSINSTAQSAAKFSAELGIFIDPNLTHPDLVVLQNLVEDVQKGRASTASNSKSFNTKALESGAQDSGYVSEESNVSEEQDSVFATSMVKERTRPTSTQQLQPGDGLKATIDHLTSLNDPNHASFVPTVFLSWDLAGIKLPILINHYLLQPYIRLARTVVRKQTDVVMLTHLIMYFTTLVPSAAYLYYNFSWIHGFLHWFMQSYYIGTYTLMMHQHIHMRGILSEKYAWFDQAFPYLTDPLMGHTWNSYFWHHVKHHHVEGNGPDDLSSTIRYQRDSILHFLQYVTRFFLLVWIDLPLYFLRKHKPFPALKVLSSEVASYTFIYLLAIYVNFPATLFTFILPLTLTRLGLMVGNWGQHAFVDEIEPDSDFRSSITLIDVASNRYCYNDGYHTSHHLNPRRHWREHPVAFLKAKQRYAEEQALVFANIDYIMLTVRLLRKDYTHLARCLIPIGKRQIEMSLEEIAAMLKTKTRRFTEEEIKTKFAKG